MAWLRKLQKQISKDRFEVSNSNVLKIRINAFFCAILIVISFVLHIYSITLFKYPTDDIYLVLNANLDQQNVELVVDNEKVSLNLFDYYELKDSIYWNDSVIDLFNILPGRINIRKPKLFVTSFSFEPMCWNYVETKYLIYQNLKAKFNFKKLTPEEHKNDSFYPQIKKFFVLELDYGNFDYLYPGSYELSKKLQKPSVIIYPILCKDVDDVEINKRLARDFLNFDPQKQRDLFNSAKQEIVEKYGKI